jgi:excisionase family DNA binding protein
MALMIKEVAEELKTSCEVVRMMCFNGRLRSHKIGGEWRIHDNAVEELFNQAQDIKREEAITGMVNAINSFDPKAQDVMCADLYDAGYHKGPKVGEKVSYNTLLDDLESYPLSEVESYIAENFDIFRKVES